jgi:hypothetical protein
MLLQFSQAGGDQRCGGFVGNDAPLIGERAITRGRMVAEGGDECAGAKGHFVRSSARLASRWAHQGTAPQRPR